MPANPKKGSIANKMVSQDRKSLDVKMKQLKHYLSEIESQPIRLKVLSLTCDLQPFSNYLSNCNGIYKIASYLIVYTK